MKNKSFFWNKLGSEGVP